MKRTKAQKGITIIALIITVVILLILAAVTITAVNEGGIISHSESATSVYNKVEKNEMQTLGGYENLINNTINKDKTNVENQENNDEGQGNNDENEELGGGYIDPDGWT